MGCFRGFAGEYGAREVLGAGVLNYGVLAARFELTFPGVEGWLMG